MSWKEYKFWFFKTYENQPIGGQQGCGGPVIMYGLLILWAIMCLSSCKSIQYVPVPEYHHDSIYFTKVQFDSIWQHDSIFVKEYMRGDTVYFEHTKWHTKYVEKAVHDTTYIERTDSLSIPVPVEKKLSRWQQVKMDVGGIAIGGCLFFFILIIIKLFLFLKRKVL